MIEAREEDAAVVFAVLVTPRASRDAVAGVHDGALRVRVTAPPVDGAANAAVCALVAKRLGVPKSAVSVVAGATSRRKTVRVVGASRAAVGALAAG